MWPISKNQAEQKITVTMPAPKERPDGPLKRFLDGHRQRVQKRKELFENSPIMQKLKSDHEKSIANQALMETKMQKKIRRSNAGAPKRREKQKRKQDEARAIQQQEDEELRDIARKNYREYHTAKSRGKRFDLIKTLPKDDQKIQRTTVDNIISGR